MKASLVAGLLVIAIIVSGVFGYTLAPTKTTTLTLISTTTVSNTPLSVLSTETSTVCSISGQPAGFELRILSDSTSTPIVAAQVDATNQPAYCGSSPPIQATSQTTATFQTTTNEWYSLPSDNNAGYSLIVTYSGQTYNLTATLRPVTITCATLYIPSGHSNVTMTEFRTSC